MKKAVILLSGGMDSTTCLAYAHAQGYACYALSVDYGQRHQAELNIAKQVAQTYGAVKHEIIKLPAIAQFGGSALTDSSIEVPHHTQSSDIPVTYVPARNTIMLSIALGWAEVLEADAIFIGVSAIDYSNYPDCRPEFIHAFSTLANLATKKGIEGHPIEILTPLIHLSKADTCRLGISLGIDYSKTVSCYQATDDGLACGVCHSCHLRKKGFIEAGIDDPTRYVG